MAKAKSEIVKQNNISHKYALGQEVFIFYKNRPIRQVIREIRVGVNERIKVIEYFFAIPDPNNQPFHLEESQVYETQKDMWNAVMSL